MQWEEQNLIPKMETHMRTGELFAPSVLTLTQKLRRVGGVGVTTLEITHDIFVLLATFGKILDMNHVRGHLLAHLVRVLGHTNVIRVGCDIG